MNNTFNLFGDIVANDAEKLFASDITPAMVIGWLAKQKGDVEININSNGGSVTAGLAIANALDAYKHKVTCNVLGVAASMASVVACAGDVLNMAKGTFLMIHNPWTVTMGNAEDLRKDAETLDKMRDSILSFYQSKTPAAADDIKSAMDAESWLTAEEAKALGFAVGDYQGEFAAAASLTRRVFDKTPAAARSFVAAKAAEEEVTAEDAPAPEAEETTSAPEAEEKRPAPEAEETTPAPEAAEEAAPAPTAQNWEARFKGLSKKLNEVESSHAAVISAKDAIIEDLKSQLDKNAQALADAQSNVSKLTAKVEEVQNALQKANDDLAQSRNSLKVAEDKAAHLESTRDLLTAGVLTVPTEASYEEQMRSAKTPEERESLRQKKARGKTK